jgi:hypothetical protein
VAEELALEKRLWNRGAVDCDEWLRRAGARRVNAAGEELLPRSGFPHEQNGHAAARGYLSRERDYFANDQTVANDVRMPPLCGGIRRPRWTDCAVPIADEKRRAPALGLKSG